MLWRLNTNLSTSLEKQGGTTLDEYLTFFFIILISSPKWEKQRKRSWTSITARHTLFTKAPKWLYNFESPLYNGTVGFRSDAARFSGRQFILQLCGNAKTPLSIELWQLLVAFFFNWNLDSLRENVTPDYLNLDAISSNWNKLLLWLKRITPVV